MYSYKNKTGTLPHIIFKNASKKRVIIFVL